ncbi:MAG: hypothetical protein NZ874_10440 [Fimbriimonadales bacterium]|nr:hypothetical protein [Fimbriimonadales bacterium]
MRYTLKQWSVRLVLALSVGLGAWTSSEAQRLTWLGTLGGSSSQAYGVSADGRVVVGWTENADYYRRAFRWTAETGMQDLGTLGGSSSVARGVSLDRRFVVGSATNADGRQRAFRWDAQTAQMQDLGTPGERSEAYSVSADGSVVVGALRRWSAWRAFRWTAHSGTVALGTLPGIVDSFAYGVSANGSIVVGAVGGNFFAFRWTAQTGMELLGTLPGGSDSAAFGVSADGTVIVGRADDATGLFQAVRWENGTIQVSGTFGDDDGEAYGVSADGSVVVGATIYPLGVPKRAFRWRNGIIEDLNIAYANLLADGSELREARSISSDGRYIVGTGYNAATRRWWEAFLLDTWRTGDTNGDGCLNDTDLLRVLFAFGTQGTPPAYHEDINRDGIVNDADLLIVLLNFGQGC